MKAFRSPRPRRLGGLLAVAVVAALTLGAGSAQAAFPGTNGQIAFSSDRNGAEDVFSMRPDGALQTRLTNAPGQDQLPVWSPDGELIVFSSQREQDVNGILRHKIFTMNAQGNAETRVADTAFDDLDPAWSRDKTRIAFRRQGGAPNSHIWSMDASGGDQLQLTELGDNLTPMWSPIADTIAYASNRDGDFEIFVMEGDGDNEQPLTDNDDFDSNPDWSPDGSKIAFQSDRDGDFDVWVMNADGTNPQQLTNHAAFDSAPAWSPDGTTLVFQSNRDGDFEIYTMPAGGGQATQLTHNTATDRVADWQPLQGPAPLRRCEDGIDNDGDTFIDHPDDPGCSSPADNNETNPRCSDGLDNDGDTFIDHPDDAGCNSPADNNEANARCSDGLDNDGDGFTDHPDDPGCNSPADNNEANAQCSDGLDNDGDGFTDHPDDIGCNSPTDNNEANAQCNDGLDNDGDGVSDHPDDPGCSSLTDNNETNAQCNDGLDNDEDGFTDYPDDGGCSSLTDNRENTAPTVLLTTNPGPGDPFQIGDTVTFNVTVLDDGPVDCSRAAVTYILKHLQHGHARESVNDCSGSLIADEGDHVGQTDLAARFVAEYTDAFGLRDTDEVDLEPNP